LRDKYNILDADFFLADLMSDENRPISITDKLYILLQSDYYQIKKEDKATERIWKTEITVSYNDNQAAHKQF
jgi:hypothetical protein